MKTWVIWSMKRFCNISKRLLVLFVLAAFLIIPFVDSVACDDCIGIAPFQGGLKISYKNLTQLDVSSSIGIASTPNKSTSQKEGKSFCSICFNAAKMINTHDTNTVFQSVSLAFQPESLTMLEPAFSVIKPPHN